MTLVVTRSALIPNCLGTGEKLAWWSWLRRLEAGGASRLPTSWSVWQKRRLWIPPMCCRAKVQQAFIRRWSAFLACSAVRALSASLLDGRPVPGLGVIPSVHEAVRDARFV